MTPRKYLELTVYSFLTWLLFYLIGLPDYYQRWYFWAKVAICIGVSLAYFPLTSYTLRRYWSDGRHQINSLWLALYLTLPLFIYDYLLLAIYKDYGIRFVFPFWYLSFFYVSFWVQIPLVGWRLQQQAQAESTTP